MGFYVFIGLSLLAKGLSVLVIPVAVAGSYYLLRRRPPARETLLSVLWGVPLALIVAATWYAPVIRRHGQPFIDQFIWQHQFARYVSNNYRHPGPVYYYLVVLVPITLPWTPFLIGGLARAASWVWRPANSADESAIKLIVFAFVWFLSPLVFFSFSSSKLPGYILPSLPAAALLIGERLTRYYLDSKTHAWKLKATGALCLLSAIVLTAYAWRFERWLFNCALDYYVHSRGCWRRCVVFNSTARVFGIIHGRGDAFSCADGASLCRRCCGRPRVFEASAATCRRAWIFASVDLRREIRRPLPGVLCFWARRLQAGRRARHL